MSQVHDPKCYRVFRRTCTNWREFAKARKYTIEANLTYSEAVRLCGQLNSERSKSQIARGTTYEFTTQ